MTTKYDSNEPSKREPSGGPSRDGRMWHRNDSSRSLDGVSGGKLSKDFMAAPSLRSGHALARGEVSRAPEPPCPEGRRLRPFGLRSLPREHAVGAYVPPDRRALRMAVVQVSGTCQTARAARGWHRTDQLNARRYRAKLYISLNSTHSLPGPRFCSESARRRAP
jgi:hypothetical protein